MSAENYIDRTVGTTHDESEFMAFLASSIEHEQRKRLLDNAPQHEEGEYLYASCIPHGTSNVIRISFLDENDFKQQLDALTEQYGAIYVQNIYTAPKPIADPRLTM